jgi:hypothetical protein
MAAAIPHSNLALSLQTSSRNYLKEVGEKPREKMAFGSKKLPSVIPLLHP